MKRWPWILVAVVVVALVAVWMRTRSRGDTPRYRTAAVERGTIEVLVSATGTVHPVEQVQVGSQVSGTVDRVLVDFNDRIRRGQVLCQIEPSSFRARVVQAEAAVARAQAALKDGQRQLNRARELLAGDYVSKADVEAAEAAVEQREAELRQAQAQLDAGRVDLDHTTIRSPIDGVVISRTIDVGQTVAASLQAPQLFVIANDLTQMEVETRIDEADIGSIRAGLPVRFTVDAFPDRTFQGSVAQVRLEPETVQGVVTYATIIRTGNPDLTLKPGMTANVSVLVATREDVLKVPNAALRFRPPAPQGGRGGGAPGGSRVVAGVGTAPGGERFASGAAADTSARRGRPGGEGGRGEMTGAPHAGEAGAATRSGETGRRGDRAGLGPRGGGEGERRWRGERGAREMAGGGGGAGGTSPKPSSAEIPPEDVPRLHPGAVYRLRGDQLVRVAVLSGDTDGAFTEVASDSIAEGDEVVVGTELSTRGNNLQPPPGMGGSPFGGGGRGGGRR